MLYNILIGPIEYILQVIFYTCFGLTNNVVASLIGLSLAVGFLTLPLYNRADVYQRIERDKRRAMEPGIKIIRKAFKGDEQFWVLSAYYKEQDYKPIYVVRSSLSLLLQIPFFVAAYHFLTHLGVLGSDNWLSYPDQWIQAGRFDIHVLPILMTVVNLMSAVIYSKEMKWKEKWQIFVLPLIFLVILYDSPAALVIYWLCNNIFSLIKNIVAEYQVKDFVKKACLILLYITGAYFFVMAVYMGCQGTKTGLAPEKSGMVVAILFLAYNLPLVFFLLLREKGIKLLKTGEAQKREFGIIVLKEAVLWVFGGFYIPISVIASSPADFLQVSWGEMGGLLQYSVEVGFGVFFIWINLVYYLADARKRNILSRVLTLLVVAVFYDHFFWGNHNGILLTDLRYQNGLEYGWKTILLSLFCFAFVVVVTLILTGMTVGYEKQVMLFLLAGLVMVSLFRVYQTHKVMETEGLQSLKAEKVQETQDQGVFFFSKDGKNVLVIMLDRAIGAYVPFIMEEKPELAEKFYGFTFYPNTVSMGQFTKLGSPGLFGGYEYAPDAINERTEETLREKHNEALKVMPVLFEKMDYQVILCDLPYADYVATSNMSIFDEYETMRTYNLEQTYAKNSQEKLLDSRQRGIAFWEYVFFKTSPYFIQPFIYQCINDRYDKGSLVYSDSFYSSYHVLENLCEMTKIDEGDTDYFMELDNNMTHEPCEFQVPEYTYPFVGEIDNSAYDFQTPRVTGGRTMRFDNRVQVNHYQTNVAALMMLGEWFTYLQEMGVYDNTRIVIAADHGFAMEQFDDLVIDEEMDAQAVNCLLMFKDFESKDWKVAEEFMTNADVPTLTLGGLVENAVNPFTGVTIDSTRKYESPIKITLSSNLRDGNVFDTSDAPWYSVHDDIFQRENWTKIKD